jgi:hypothetical protein
MFFAGEKSRFFAGKLQQFWNGGSTGSSKLGTVYSNSRKCGEVRGMSQMS